jgi:hypothetical protein
MTTSMDAPVKMIASAQMPKPELRDIGLFCARQLDVSRNSLGVEELLCDNCKVTFIPAFPLHFPPVFSSSSSGGMDNHSKKRRNG